MSHSQILNLSSMRPPVFIRDATLECQFKDHCCCCPVAKSCPTLATTWTGAWEVPLSMGFPRQKYWRGLPFPSPRNLPTMYWQADSLPLSHRGSPIVVQLLICIWLSAAPWTAARQVSLSFCIFQSLLKFMSTESVVPSNYLIPHCPLVLLPSIFTSMRSFPMSQLFVSGGQSIGASQWMLL